MSDFRCSFQTEESTDDEEPSGERSLKEASTAAPEATPAEATTPAAAPTDAATSDHGGDGVPASPPPADGDAGGVDPALVALLERRLESPEPAEGAPRKLATKKTISKIN